MRGTRWFAIGAVVAALVSLVLLAAACGDDEEDGATATPTEPAATEPSADTTPPEGAIAIALGPGFQIVADPETAAAGTVTFNIANEGEEVHEFVVISTDLDPGELPTAADGSVDETQAGMTVIDEVEDLQAGSSEELTVSLDAGSYALICNLVEEAGSEHAGDAHYTLGMFAAFAVTE